MGKGGADSSLVTLSAGCCCVWSIIGTALLAASFSVLTPQELGLKWDNVFLKLEDGKVYTSGRHYVNVGGSFYKFPRKLNYVEYTGRDHVDVWSKDGQEMYLEASFYYKLREDKIFDIFYQMGDKYPQIIEGIAAKTIRVSDGKRKRGGGGGIDRGQWKGKGKGKGGGAPMSTPSLCSSCFLSVLTLPPSLLPSSSLQDVATSFDTLEFFTNRSAIDDAISSALAQ